MRYKSIITAAILGTSLIVAPGCKDEFAEVNTNPSAVKKRTCVSYLQKR